MLRSSPSLPFLLLTCACAQERAPEPGPAAAAFVAAGPGVPLTIHPVHVLGRPSAEVADVLGLVLEQHGFADLSVADRAFDSAGAAWAEVPARYAAFVRGARGAGGAARHALWAEFLGDPRSGPTEVRFVVVDADGGLVVADRCTPADAAFARTAGRDPDPLGCAALVAARLGALTGWKAKPVRDGRFAEKWRQKSGAPDAEARAAMQARRDALRKDLADARIAVLPTLVLNGHDAASADRLAAAAARDLGCRVVAARSGAALRVGATSNQQKRLWDLAAALRRALQEEPPDADYGLVADLADADGGRGFAHFVLATRAGEPVLADLRNDRHPGFAAHAARGLAGLEDAVVARLVELLR